MKPVRLFLRLIVALAIIEILVMIVLAAAGVRGGGLMIALDASFLVLLAAPVVYFWVVRTAMESTSRQAELERAVQDGEAALRETSATLRAIIDGSPLAVIATDLDRKVTLWNPASERLFGWTAAEAMGRLNPIVPEGKWDEYAALSGQAVEGRTLVDVEVRRRRKDGSLVDVSLSTASMRDGRGNACGIVGFFSDITERKRAEETLKEREEQYRYLFESNPNPMWVYDLETLAFLAINNAAVSRYGYSREEFLGMTIKDIRPTEDVPALLENVSKVTEGIDEAGIWRHRKKDGTIISVKITSHTMLFDGRRCEIVLAHDVTREREMESQLRQAQKMEAVGRLAGGVAHDFNNLLTAISGYSDLLLVRLSAHDPVRREVEEIRKASDRAASLTRQLLAFSRRQVLQPRVLDLNAVVADMNSMVRRLIGEDIDLVVVPGAGLWRVKADPGQIEQVIVNLAVNARDAMPGGGRLTIDTSNAEVAAPSDAARLSLPPGPYAVLTVADTGEGMTAETISHIFEPFFTTKEAGKGTGLGLATVYGIVAQSGGAIDVASAPGRGTSFRVYLPRVEAEAEPPAPVVRGAEDHRGTETILLVEDEDAVRTLVLTILKRKGYAVLTARNGGEALLVCERHSGRIELMVTDVVMPGMGGPDLARRLSPLRPGMKTLYMSGYTDDEIVHPGDLEPGTHYIQKPFTPDALARKVREVLDAKSLKIKP